MMSKITAPTIAPNSTRARNNGGPRHGNGPAHNRSPVGSHASGPHDSSSANDSMSGRAQSEPTKCQHEGQCGASHLVSLPTSRAPDDVQMARVIAWAADGFSLPAPL